MKERLVSKWINYNTGERATITRSTDSFGDTVYLTRVRGPLSRGNEPSRTNNVYDHTTALKRLGFTKES